MGPFINTTCQLRAYKHPHFSLGKTFSNNGVEEFLPMVQLNSFVSTTLSRRKDNNIQGILFGFLDQFVLSLRVK